MVLADGGSRQPRAYPRPKSAGGPSASPRLNTASGRLAGVQAATNSAAGLALDVRDSFLVPSRRTTRRSQHGSGGGKPSLGWRGNHLRDLAETRWGSAVAAAGEAVRCDGSEKGEFVAGSQLFTVD